MSKAQKRQISSYFLFGGWIVGFLELISTSSFFVGRIALIPLLLFSVSALFGYFIEGALKISSRLIVFGLCPVLLLLLLTHYPLLETTISGGVFIFFVWKRRSENQLLLPLLHWISALLVLSPLYQGESAGLVFTSSQLFFLWGASTLSLFIIFEFLLKFCLIDYSTKERIITFLVSVTLLIGLHRCSSLFLIRLWGFHTMEYLQGMVLYLYFLAGAVLTRSVIKESILTPTLNSLPIVLLGIVPALLLCSFSSIEKEVLFHKMPFTSFLLSRIGQLVDQDKDGTPALLGMGDCDDHNSALGPQGLDWPNNGKDENCFGGDTSFITHNYFSLTPHITLPKEPVKKRIALLFFLDTLRADALYEAERWKTSLPVLSNIMKESTVYSRAYAQSNNTLDSAPYFLHLGFRNLSRYESAWTLRSLLERGKIDSWNIQQASLKWWDPKLSEEFLGFAHREIPDPSRRMIPLQEYSSKISKIISDNASSSAFYFIHFESLHDYPSTFMEGNRILNRGVNAGELIPLLFPLRTVETLKKRYRQALTDIDASLQSIWSAIKQKENEGYEILALFVSDHGEEFLEHGGLFHMGTLYEEVVHVPLVLYTTNREGKLLSSQKNNYQIPPTILDFLGYTGKFIDTFSLFRDGDTEQEFFSTFTKSGNSHERFVATRLRNYKIVHDLLRNITQIFNLDKDPNELQNIVEEEFPEKKELFKKMDNILFYMNYGDVILWNRLHQNSP